MLKNPLRILSGSLAALLFVLNLLFFPNLLFIVAFLKFLIPIQKWKDCCTRFMHEWIVPGWVSTNNFIIKLTTPTQWDIQGTGELSPHHWYFLIANHQSWVDIMVLQKVFNHKIPLLKFFLKQELLWTLPFASWVCWILDFPVVTRYSKSYLKKYPEKKGKDIETTKQSCEKFKLSPTTIANYLEGTRFTPQKQEDQKSPYHHLLKPKAGGLAFSLFLLQDHIKNLINVTIVYPEGKCTFSDLIFGRIHKIIVRYEVLPVPTSLIGDYANDKRFRTIFQQQLNQYWKEKDELMDSLIPSKKE